MENKHGCPPGQVMKDGICIPEFNPRRRYKYELMKNWMKKQDWMVDHTVEFDDRNLCIDIPNFKADIEFNDNDMTIYESDRETKFYYSRNDDHHLQGEIKQLLGED